MKRAMNDEAGLPITLERYLGSRLLPLAALVSACPGSIDDPSRFGDGSVLDATITPDATVAPDAPTCVDYVERTLLPTTCATA